MTISKLDALKWLRKTINTNRMLRMEKLRDVSFIQGKMLFMTYNAKWKKDLKYWDRTPVLFCIDSSPKGFLGLSLHYLQPDFRTRLFNALLEYENGNKRALDFTYAEIASFSRHKYAKFVLKKYLFSQIKNLLIVDQADWKFVSALPVHDFQKQPVREVWRDARKFITGDSKKNPK